MQSSIHAVLLAGVHQWRPSVFERWVPRTLVPILNRPLVDYPLAWLQRAEIESVRVCANSDTHALRDRFGASDPSGIQVSFYEDVMPRGPAGCLADAMRDRDGDTIIVVDATIIPDAIDLSAAIQSHRNSDAIMTVVAGVKFGAAAKRESLSPLGVYLLSRKALTHIPATGYQDIKEMLVPRLYDAGARVGVHRVTEPAIRVTGAASCFAATEWLLSRHRGDTRLPAGMTRLGSAIVHESSRISTGVRFIGPSWVGPDVEITTNATIVGPTSIGSGAFIAEGAHVCRSILWDGASVGAEAILDRGIVTSGASISSGAHVSHRIHHRAIRTTAKATPH